MRKRKQMKTCLLVQDAWGWESSDLQAGIALIIACMTNGITGTNIRGSPQGERKHPRM